MRTAAIVECAAPSLALHAGQLSAAGYTGRRAAGQEQHESVREAVWVRPPTEDLCGVCNDRGQPESGRQTITLRSRGCPTSVSDQSGREKRRILGRSIIP